MGKKQNVDMSATETEIKIVETPEEIKAKSEDATKDSAEEATKSAKKAKAAPKKGRGKQYKAVRSQVDRTKTYDPASAIELVKKLSYSKFDGSVDASLVLKEVGISATFAFPHSTGKSVKVAIVDEKLLKDIEAGKIEFDVLVSSPEFMPKLAKHARVLGPKGLMPNPKNGTLTPNPELKKKELEAGSITIKTDKKAPLINLSIGKTSMETKDLVENLEALLKAFNNKVERLSVSASMSPGVKVTLEK